jgi:toluene monooxygenase system protein E
MTVAESIPPPVGAGPVQQHFGPHHPDQRPRRRRPARRPLRRPKMPLAPPATAPLPASASAASRITGRGYNELQDRKKDVIDGLLRELTRHDCDADADAGEWVAFLQRWHAPLRFPMHGLQTLAAFVAKMAPSSRSPTAPPFNPPASGAACTDRLPHCPARRPPRRRGSRRLGPAAQLGGVQRAPTAARAHRAGADRLRLRRGVRRDQRGHQAARRSPAQRGAHRHVGRGERCPDPPERPLLPRRGRPLASRVDRCSRTYGQSPCADSIAEWIDRWRPLVLRAVDALADVLARGPVGLDPTAVKSMITADVEREQATLRAARTRRTRTRFRVSDRTTRPRDAGAQPPGHAGSMSGPRGSSNRADLATWANELPAPSAGGPRSGGRFEHDIHVPDAVEEACRAHRPGR